MARCKKYIETDVYTEALKRINHVYDCFDSVVVMFSGGKDSMATLHLCKEVAEQRGRLPVDVVFRDEEVIPANVIATVDEYRLKDWVRMIYFAVPLNSQKFILGKSISYVQWDKKRPHIRPVPAHAVTLPEGDDRVFGQHDMDAFTAQYYKGKIAFVTGIRAAESLMRYRASVNKLNENYINAVPQLHSGTQSANNVKLVKPIFDWEEADIFKYFHIKGIKYCPIYDAEIMAGSSLRVSTPLHAESAKKFHKLKEIDPVFYQQVIDIFPEMLVHERYYRDIDTSYLYRQYGESLDGVRQFIEDFMQDDEKIYELAVERFNKTLSRATRNPYNYPPDYVLKHFINGTYKRQILPYVRTEDVKRPQ